MIKYRHLHNKFRPFSELAKLVKLSEDEDESEDGTDDGCDSDAVVPLSEGVNHISCTKSLKISQFKLLQI